MIEKARLKHKILSILLAVVMLVGMLPMTVNAAAGGSCGENLTWTLDDNGVLTISGTGDMTNYGSTIQYPWYAQGITIKEVVVGSGVTSIGDYAFSTFSTAYQLLDIEKVTISGNTAIGKEAFRANHNLVSVAIYGSGSIGYRAFMDCYGLTTVIYRGTIHDIYDRNSCFLGCDALSSFTLLEGVGIDSLNFCEATKLTMKFVDDTGADVTEFYRVEKYSMNSTTEQKITVYADLSKGMIGVIPVQVYTGAEIKPQITVIWHGQTVSEDKYTVSYSNNVDIGIATVTVTGKGDQYYTGSVSGSFAIAEPATDSNSDGVYEISTAAQLFWFSQLVNGSRDMNQSAVLTADIDMDGFAWTAIGANNAAGYTGTFDGQGYTIKNLNRNAGLEDGQKESLFAKLGEGSVVKNLIVDNADVWTSNHYSLNASGVIAMENSGTISGCILTNSNVQQGAYEYLGGIAGLNTESGVIENCAVVDSNLSRRWGGTSNKTMGGIVQTNNGLVKNCYTYGCTFSNGTTENGAIIAKGTAPMNCYYYTASTVSETYGTAKDVSSFTSGEIAFLLGAPFGQNIDNGGDNDGWPVISNVTVYEARDCQGDVVYSNTDGETVHYPFDEPSFGWSYDWTECMAIITCSKCLNTVYYAECTVTVDTSDPSKTVYTASFTYNGQTYTNTQEIENVISVNISWGAMEFTYTDGAWQPESHTYADGKWTPDEEGGNVITVQNNGNMAVNVTFAYDKTVSEVEGSFTNESGNAVASSVALAVDEEKKFKLLLSGKPNSALDNATLGSITVTISLPSEEEES